MVNSSHRRRRSNVVESSRSAVKAPQFFKIVNSSVHRQRKLRIPRKFVSKHGKNLANLVFLKVPTGAVWKVELINSNEDVWLCNGWKEFTEYYSIRCGHFMVFRYDEKSYFHVLIFDMSASEIEYPFSATQNLQVLETEDNEIGDSVEILEDFPTHQTKGEEISGRDETEKDFSVEILDGFPRYQTRRKKPASATYSEDTEKGVSVEILDDPPTCRRRRRRGAISVSDFPTSEMKRTNLRCKMENTDGLKLPNLKMDVKLHCLKHEINKERSGGIQIPDPKQSATVNGRARALQRAKAFRSENPFFMVSMRPSYVSTKFGLNVPLEFAKKYFSRKQSDVILRVSDGRTWPVKSYCSANGKCKLCWVSFARDNNLKVGDVCVFELIKASEPCLNVTMFRAV